MTLRRTWGMALVAALAGSLLLPACNRRKPAEVNPISPSITVNRTRAPLGIALEVTYTWTLEPGAKKLDRDYRALVHFLDNHEVMLFDDDHDPVPPTSAWEPGKTYSYTRTRFVPIYPYVGEVEVRMGLYPYPGRGERPALKGEDKGFREYKVATLELLPQTENVFLVSRVSRSSWRFSTRCSTIRSTLPRCRVCRCPCYRCPVRRSRAATRRIGELLRHALPQAPHVTFAEVGHMGPFTHSTAINALIRRFLDELPDYSLLPTPLRQAA